MENYLKYEGYIGSVKYSNDDKILYGKVIGISDLISYEGNSISELEKNFNESVEDYLETCKELNKVPNGH